MKKLVKIITLLSLLLFVLFSGTWYYIALQVASKANEQYGGKQLTLKDLDNTDYFASFKNVTISGFPSKIEWEVNGWQEESSSSYIDYKSPIKIGYDLIKQSLFVNYDGDIVASYKPKQHGFGSKLKISDYKIIIDLPLSIQLVKDLTKNDDPAILINHIKNITTSTQKVEIFDLVDQEKFYDKEFESLNIMFKPAKTYTSTEDFLDNIPQHYVIDYKIKTNQNNAVSRRLPVSLLYGFAMMPSGLNLQLHADIKTKAKSYKEYKKGLEIDATTNSDSTYFAINNLVTDYKSKHDNNITNHHLKKTAKFTIKNGFFDYLIESYQRLDRSKPKSNLSKLIDNEINYILAHKDALNFHKLENEEYEVIFDINSEERGGSIYSKLNDLTLLSKTSGIKMQHTMEHNLLNNRIKAEGALYLNNYPAIVEFVSAYIYRLGKYRALSDIARNLYIDVNKRFLKKISDHPKANSNDLSLAYVIDSQNYSKSKIGSTTIAQIIPLYTLTLYQELFDKVGYEGDVLSKMRKIIPSIDGNEPMLKNILPKISIQEKIQNKIETIIPKSDIKNKLLDSFM